MTGVNASRQWPNYNLLSQVRLIELVLSAWRLSQACLVTVISIIYQILYKAIFCAVRHRASKNKLLLNS